MITSRIKSKIRIGLRRRVLFPNAYAWYVLLSACDIMFTWVILHLDGVELNILADWVIEHGGLPATVAYKFILMLIVVLLCEAVGRRREIVGLRMAQTAIGISAIPVGLALVQLLLDVWKVAS